MSEYKRLTDKEYGYKKCASCSYRNCQYCDDICEIKEQAHTRLSELEDKIENGTLVELPCKVGTLGYCLAVRFKGFFRRKSVYGVVEYPFDLTMVDSYKITWFLTKDEAEAQLKELREKQK